MAIGTTWWCRSRSQSRRGIALIVVLGFLSILILMAVALVTLTRTERLVSAYTAEGVRCRQLTRGALDRAMADLNAYFNQYKLVRLMPQDAVFISLGDGGKVGGNTGMFRGSETNWLPWSYLVNPTSHYDVIRIWDTQAEWILIRDPTNFSAGTILGRIAYAIVDCTGLLDANVLGKDTLPQGVYRNNPTRLTVGDIGLERLPEAVGDAADLAFNRNYYHTFLTFREVLVFNDGIAGRYKLDERAVFSTDIGIRTVSPYSLSYDHGKWWNPAAWRWQTGLGGNVVPNVNEWTEAQAAEVFQTLFGVDPNLAGQMAQAFMDYRDSDRLPRSTQSITLEAVPMLNEFVWSGQVDTDAGGNATLTVRIVPETWYPFPSRSPDGAYQFPPNTPTVSSTPGAGNITLGIQTSGGSINYGTVAPNDSAVIGAIAYNGGNPLAWPPLVYQIPLPGVTAGAPLRVAARLERVQLQNAGGSVVDEAIGPRMWPQFNVRVPQVGGTASFGPSSLEVNDPRLNHLANAWAVAGAGTPGARNNSGSAERLAEGADMYVRDGDLQSVAELGFICMSANETQPWTTVPLYGQAGRRLLAMFRASPVGVSWLDGKRVWTNGYLNPNTHFRSALDAAFYGVNYAEVPDHPVTNTWTDPMQMSALLDNIVSMLSVTQFYSGADWVMADALAPNGALAVAGLNNNQREAIIRNTHRLFSANGNLYSVFVVGQTFQEGNTNVVSAEKRLVALVWHDPFPDEQNSRRQWFIRWFKWLEE